MTHYAGGAVRIESTSPHGTSIVMLLKRGVQPAATQDYTADVSEISSSRSVLVVDDDPDVREFLAESLGVMGYDVFLAEDGESGPCMLEKVSPDVLLLDFAMPGMTGAEVANRVRADRPAMPIIFASGYSDTAAIEAAVGTPAVLLRKPFRLEAWRRRSAWHPRADVPGAQPSGQRLGIAECRCGSHGLRIGLLGHEGRSSLPNCSEGRPDRACLHLNGRDGSSQGRRRADCRCPRRDEGFQTGDLLRHPAEICRVWHHLRPRCFDASKDPSHGQWSGRVLVQAQDLSDSADGALEQVQDVFTGGLPRRGQHHVAFASLAANPIFWMQGCCWIVKLCRQMNPP
jgi:CheY-like chemotaxis protein